MLAGLAGSVIHSGASSSGSRIPSSSQSALVIHSGATSSPSRMVSSSQSGSVIHSALVRQDQEFRHHRNQSVIHSEHSSPSHGVVVAVRISYTLRSWFFAVE